MALDIGKSIFFLLWALFVDKLRIQNNQSCPGMELKNKSSAESIRVAFLTVSR
jgi:hypothetical protein